MWDLLIQLPPQRRIRNPRPLNACIDILIASHQTSKMLPGGVTTQYVDNWVAQGLFTPERILERFLLKRTNTYNINAEGLEAAFDSVASEDETGIQRIDDTGFIKLLTCSNVLPKHLMNVGSILFQSIHYLSIYPFRHEHPSALTLSELTRGLLWLMPYEKGVTFKSWGGGWCELSPADHRRLIFQSLATERNGHELPYDVDDWRREARRRAYGLPDEKIKSTLPQLGDPNYDEWGDELYHDLLSVVMTAQPKRNLPLAGEPRDAFRPLASRLHEREPPRLYRFTIPADRLRVFVQLMLYHTFEISGSPSWIGTWELELVTDCIIRAFVQSSDVGINWPMFDEGCRAAVREMLMIWVGLACSRPDNLTTPHSHFFYMLCTMSSALSGLNHLVLRRVYSSACGSLENCSNPLFLHNSTRSSTMPALFGSNISNFPGFLVIKTSGSAHQNW